MTREELRYNYEKEICELCCREYYTSRTLPESLCEGRGTKVKAKKGSLITLTEWWTPSPYKGESEHNFIKRIKTEYVDGVNIKEDTWYEIKNGEFVETPPYPYKH